MEEKALVGLRQELEDGLQVEYKIQPIVSHGYDLSSKQKEIFEQIDSINNYQSILNEKINALNNEIDRLTNHSDGWDLTVSVVSGALAGMLDIFWVGEMNIWDGREWGSEKVESFVKWIAKKKGCDLDADGTASLRKAISHLEEGYPYVGDEATNFFGGGTLHHLRDLSHHPNMIGLTFSLLTQFTGKAYGTDNAGVFTTIDVCGSQLIGKNLPEKFLFGVVNWFFHMVSDMAGSSGSVAKGLDGTGLPGPLLSLVKTVSAMPIFKNMQVADNMNLAKWLQHLFNGSVITRRGADGMLEGYKFDLRGELGVIHELGKLSVPIIMNECIVRSFYFIRRFVHELKAKDIKKIDDIKKIEPSSILPFNNRTIARMLTISLGVFEVIDLADAAIRSTIKNGAPNNPLFWKDFILRVNFIGIGRFAIAISTDVSMGMKKTRLRNERIKTLNEFIHLSQAKVFYKQANLWIEIQKTEESINQLEALEKQTLFYFQEWYRGMSSDLLGISEVILPAQINNPELSDIINKLL